jgi:hypothetical protein
MFSWANRAGGDLSIPVGVVHRAVPGGPQNDDARVGIRLRAGTVLLPECGLNLEGGVLMWESQSSLFSAASDGSTILALPFTRQGGASS